METEILKSLIMQIDALKLNRKQDDINQALPIFSPKYRRKNMKKGQCLLNLIDQVYGLYTENHAIDNFPLLPSWKSFMQDSIIEFLVEQIYFVNQRQNNFTRPFQTNNQDYYKQVNPYPIPDWNPTTQASWTLEENLNQWYKKT